MARIIVVTCPGCGKPFQASHQDFRGTDAKLRCPYCALRFLDRESPCVDDRRPS